MEETCKFQGDIFVLIPFCLKFLNCYPNFQKSYNRSKGKEVAELPSREERLSCMSEKEKRNESRNQSRHMEAVRQRLDFMTEQYGASFVLCSSFPNYKQRSVQTCSTGIGKDFLERDKCGKFLESYWVRHNVMAQKKHLGKSY